MHDALLIPEVRNAILDMLPVVADLDVLPQSRYGCLWHPIRTAFQKDGQRALATLARTCRALSEPALDVLWRQLHSLEPFVRCSRANIGVAGDEPLAPFTEEEWDIVSQYSPRVQELEVSNTDTHILRAFWFCTTLLLPNLRKLHWSLNYVEQITSIRLFLSPSLVNLYVWVGDGNHTSMLGFLEHYHKLCPNVKSLYFDHVSRKLSPLGTAGISRAVSRSPDLEVFTCQEIDENTIIHLIQSRRLTALSVNLHHHHPDNLRRLAGYGVLGDVTPFQSLRFLNLYVQDISSVTPYLHSTHQPFEEISIEFLLISPPDDLHKFFSALNSSVRRQTLRRIRLINSGPDRANIMQLDLELLSPLLAFNLRVLDIDVAHPISLDDGELVQLAQVWPNLETFCLSQNNKHLPFRLPSLRSLLLVPACCPKLRILGLCIDARTTPVLTEEEAGIRHVFIQQLKLSYSPITPLVVPDVAQFLRDHFPSLTSLPLRPQSLPAEAQSTYRSLWKKVNEKVKEAHRYDLPWSWGYWGSDIDMAIGY